MTNFDKIKTRIIIARSVGLPPDEIKVIECHIKNNIVLYELHGFKGHNLCLGFDHVPTIEEAREKVKNLYLCGVEWDFDEEMKTI